MTQFFAYNDYTYPEIEALPRDTPIVLPLGQGYDLERLAGSLSHPEKIYLLPAVPYGWRGSGLAVPEVLLQPMLLRLVESLDEDGFSNVFVLAPQDSGLQLGRSGIVLYHPSQHVPSSLLPPDSARGKVIVAPVGHTEQHAYHLPMSTDTLIIAAIGEGIAAAAPERAWSLPVMPYGVSTHRQAFAGTLSCGGREFEGFWVALVDVLAGRGFDRIYLINGHGGNHSFLVNAVKYAGERQRRLFCATSWLYLSGESGVQSLQSLRSSPIGGMGHACELETSLILHLRPDLVHLERAVDEMAFISTPNYYMDWVEGGALIANPSWDDDTQTGAYGAGSLGSPEKGAAWLSAAIAEKVGHVEEIHEQHLRREARRSEGFGLWGRGKEPLAGRK